MIRHGEPPYLECSSKGDIRFSAFWARVASRDNRTIESIYQGSKVLSGGKTGLTWREAKGKRAVNQEEIAKLYSLLWDEYISENLNLLEILRDASGLQDTFGQQGHCCQATELWRIRGDIENPEG